MTLAMAGNAQLVTWASMKDGCWYPGCCELFKLRDDICMLGVKSDPGLVEDQDHATAQAGHRIVDRVR